VRTRLRDALVPLGFDVMPSAANFLLCHLPEDGPSAADVVSRCRQHQLFIRDTSTMGVRDAVRIAVKDLSTSERMTEIVSGALAMQPA